MAIYLHFCFDNDKAFVQNFMFDTVPMANIHMIQYILLNNNEAPVELIDIKDVING